MYAANVAANIVDPLIQADTDTEVITTWRPCYVLHHTSPDTDTDTPGSLGFRVYNQKVADGNQVACAPLVNYLRCAATTSTVGDPPTIAQTAPMVPLADSHPYGSSTPVTGSRFPFLKF